MKKSVLKKSLMLSVLFSAFVLAGCNNSSSEPQEPSVVEVIKAESVVPETRNANAVPVTQEIFESVVSNKLKAEMEELTNMLSATPQFISAGSNARTVTFEDLESSFAKIPESIKFEMNDDGDAGSIRGNWSAPTGEIDFGENVKGISAQLDAMRYSLNAGYNMSTNGGTGSINASTRFAGSVTVDTSTEEISSSIKYGKINFLTTSGVDNVLASINMDKIYQMGTFDRYNMESSSITNVLNVIDTLTGRLSVYEGINGAAYFEVEDNGTIYNGIIKADICGTVDYLISKENVNALVGTIVTIIESFTKNTFDEKDIEPLDELVNLKVDISVYDTDGEKLFDLLTLNKLSDAFSLVYPEIQKLIPVMNETWD